MFQVPGKLVIEKSQHFEEGLLPGKDFWDFPMGLGAKPWAFSSPNNLIPSSQQLKAMDHCRNLLNLLESDNAGGTWGGSEIQNPRKTNAFNVLVKNSSFKHIP